MKMIIKRIRVLKCNEWINFFKVQVLYNQSLLFSDGDEVRFALVLLPP